MNKHFVGFHKRYFLQQTSTPYNESLKRSKDVLTFYIVAFIQWQLAVKNRPTCENGAKFGQVEIVTVSQYPLIYHTVHVQWKIRFKKKSD